MGGGHICTPRGYFFTFANDKYLTLVVEVVELNRRII